jgi:hypothetical protein
VIIRVSVVPGAQGCNDLARALVINGNETTVRDRVQELLTSGLDELLLLGISIADEAKERRQLLHLVGSL